MKISKQVIKRNGRTLDITKFIGYLDNGKSDMAIILVKKNNEVNLATICKEVGIQLL
jgi:hypothetical protein